MASVRGAHHYQRVRIASLGYQLAPIVVTSAELEDRLAPIYQRLRLPMGQLAALTGVEERRWWERDHRLSDGAVAAGAHALQQAGIAAADLDAVVYAGVCREHAEPATACRVAHELGVGATAEVFDISNACLGVLNGMLAIAQRIELGQVRAGLVVACESAREINEIAIARLAARPDLENYARGLATLTGGSGAAAVLLMADSGAPPESAQLLGGVARAAPAHHELCRWGTRRTERLGELEEFMTTDSVAVLKHGVELGLATWRDFLTAMNWRAADIARTICHQVGSAHRDTILPSLGVAAERDFITYPFLGNMGTVSLPLTAALALERGVLARGHRTALLGIGSGLNCLMLGCQW
ncbi:MAG: 3-oxoacyl-ACP synthase III [Planctomycetota bacterium]